MHLHRLSAAILATALWLPPGAAARADVVTDWNKRAVAAVQASGQPLPAQARGLAMVHLAMFEALNAIEPRFAPYRSRLAVEPGASSAAAAAAAAHTVLTRLYPAAAHDLDFALHDSLTLVADGPSRARGIRLGEQAAITLLIERSFDGADASAPYRPHTSPGMYVPTVLPQLPQWGRVRPFALKAGDQFRPRAPYAEGSARWVRDYDEVRRLGAKTGAARTPAQDELARFWEGAGVATYNALARQVGAARALTPLANARLFALVNMAAADALIAAFDAKYAYKFWRPVTAIRNGDLGGQPAVMRDPAWESAVPTPLNPEYPCADSIAHSAAAAVLQALFGDALPAVRLAGGNAPARLREYHRLSDYVAEVVDARVYHGVQFRGSAEAGAAMGRKVGAFVVRNQLYPAHAGL